MVRTNQGLKYEEDLSDGERQLIQQDERLYKRTHVGKKIVEAFLLPSARTGTRRLTELSYLNIFTVEAIKLRA